MTDRKHRRIKKYILGQPSICQGRKPKSLGLELTTNILVVTLAKLEGRLYQISVYVYSLTVKAIYNRKSFRIGLRLDTPAYRLLSFYIIYI
jgi:hypothetical protein